MLISVIRAGWTHYSPVHAGLWTATKRTSRNTIRFLTDDPLPHTHFAEDPTLREWRPALRARLRALHSDHGVKLELCNVTRESVGLEEPRLYAGVELVPVGEARLAELQGLGYRYLKVE
jgi:intracellular sulfur oxidation DsrE/DsrF family protein